MKRELICIACPRGCLLNADQSASGVVVGGNRCSKGEEYARAEVLDPRRTITAVIMITDAQVPCIPVRTDKPIPKGMVKALLEQLRSLEVRLPVKRGQVLLADFNKTGANVVCTRTLPVPLDSKK